MQTLIGADELAALLDASPDGSAAVVADVRWSLGGPPGEPLFRAGHLPGAQYVDLDTELAGPVAADRAGGRHPLPRTETFQAAMRRIGVGAETPVVIYDDASALAAARLWWLLTDAGHPSVAVLNGGLSAWAEAGYRLDSGPAREVVAGDFVARPGQRGRVDAEELVGLADRPVVDVRAYERYTGASEPMDPVAGHLPGARSAPSTSNLGPDGRFLPPTEIVDRYRALDQLEGEPVFYCGSGITAAHTLLARESAGLRRGVIYPGSWSDWVSNPARPVATGDGPRF